MILRAFIFIISLLLGLCLAQDFRCSELLDPASSLNLLTFEYNNPKTGNRGVVCISWLNNRDSMVMYLEEEEGTNSHTGEDGKGGRKQAVGRAHRVGNSATLYSGLIHVTKNVADQHEDHFDLDNSPFTLAIVPETGLATFTIRSRLSVEEDVVLIWRPRGGSGVSNWVMRVEIPQSCGATMKSYNITDPIPLAVNNVKGVVCVLESSATSFKYFSLGWRRAGVAGKPRKFVNFGSLRSANANFVNVFSGRVHSIEFPAPCENSNIKADRLAFKDTLIVRAVKSINSPSLILYGDLHEIWVNQQNQNPLDPKFPPKYPLIPANFSLNLKSKLQKIIYK